jgi:hypothetical protein
MSEVIFIIENSERIKNISDYYITIINNILNIYSAIKPNILTSIIYINDDTKYSLFRKNINDIHKITLQDLEVSGNFKLHDNFCAVLNRIKTFQDKTKSDSPIVILLTYDKDNASIRINESLSWVQTTINKAYGWKFIFLTSTAESFNIGKKIGFNTCIQYEIKNKHCEEIVYIFEYLIKNNFDSNLNLNIKDVLEKDL